MTRSILPALLLLSLSLVAGCRSGDGDSQGADASTQGDASSDVYQVKFTTTKGDFVVEVNRAWSPNGADRFRELVDVGFYDECRFFRVVAGFMAQFGVNGTPATNSMWSSRTIQDDVVTAPNQQSNMRGFVSFAKTGAPNSRTTQLFINFGNNSFLDAMGFTPFGRVISGMDVVDALYSAYGETSNQQGQISAQGNSYLDTNFPMLDHIVTARVQ